MDKREGAMTEGLDPEEVMRLTWQLVPAVIDSTRHEGIFGAAKDEYILDRAESMARSFIKRRDERRADHGRA